MKKKLVMGNWKMNGNHHQITQLLNKLLSGVPAGATVECSLFPPSLYIPLVSEKLSNTAIAWGAQNIYPKDDGAYTGEISALMLADYKCRYVLVGHSERRHLFHENEKFIAEKFHHVKEHGMMPVLCVGETIADREKGLIEEVIRQQLLSILEVGHNDFKNCVVAYEPVWAIGTGRTASPQQAQEIHALIRALIAEIDKEAATKLPILYGGSVNEKNAQSLFAMPDVDGGLVGGASLDAQQFVEIVKCIN